LEGLAGWWTPEVSGASAPGDELRFEFSGVGEHIIMRVETVEQALVRWHCVTHSALPDWRGTTIVFALGDDPRGRCVLDLTHLGLVPALECSEDCALGWDYFLASLVGYVDRGRGTPFSGQREDRR